MKYVLKATLALVSLAVAGVAQAQTRSQVYGGALTQETQTVFVRTDVGLETLDSQSAASKDTTTAARASVGGWAGEDRILGINLSHADTIVPFALNGAKSHTNFTDARMMARFGWFVPSIGASLAQVDIANGKGAPLVGVFGTGANAGIAVEATLAPFLVVHGETMVTQFNSVYDKLNQSTRLDRKIDADLNASFDLTPRMVDLLVGYRAEQYGIVTGDRRYVEAMQGAYVGVRLGVYF